VRAPSLGGTAEAPGAGGRHRGVGPTPPVGPGCAMRRDEGGIAGELPMHARCGALPCTTPRMDSKEVALGAPRIQPLSAITGGRGRARARGRRRTGFDLFRVKRSDTGRPPYTVNHEAS